VAISVFIYGDKYQVAVSPPEGPNWRSSEPMTATEILKKLGQLGCHSTDITDALSAADLQWTKKHDEAAAAYERAGCATSWPRPSAPAGRNWAGRSASLRSGPG
jgi:hypothetical protein